MVLQGKRVLLGISGGIAAYKSVEVLRGFQRMGAEVQVVMTEAAQRFVQPLTFEALSQRKVYTELFPTEGDPNIIHVHLGKWADVNVVAPATANLIGKLANGLADDVLTCTLLAAEAPTLIAPAMESHMYARASVQRNLRVLHRDGFHQVGPGDGPLASGASGPGRMAEPGEIADAVAALCQTCQSLKGRRILVTAGPTEQPIDPVRFITNRSTGKMGYAIAEQAQKRGADVHLITGPTALSPPPGVEVDVIRTVFELREATLKAFEKADALIMTAAVLDFRPSSVADFKIKKTGESLNLELVPNDDFLVGLGKAKGNRVVIGFAMETNDPVENARRKLEAKHLDLIVLNDLTVAGAGFAVDTNVVTLIEPTSAPKALPLMSKHAVADHLMDWLESQWEI